MSWRNVVITQHAKLSYASRMMVVQTIKGINQIPISDVSTLLIDTQQAVITSALISELSKQQVKVIFTDEAKEPVCEMVSKQPNNRSIQLLNDQFQWDQQRKETLWTLITMNKIRNQIQVIRSLGGDAEILEHELNQMEVNDLTNREAVVARKYFPMLFNEMKFSRHDVNEPINDALNYGYSILLSTVNKAIVSNGYLTYLGIHHHSDDNAFNLGSDLMEPFRPIIDMWVYYKDFKQLTPEVKYGLVGLLNQEIHYNGHTTLLMNALSDHVRDCLKYLSDGKTEVQIKVGFTDEVSSYAANGHV